MIFKNIYILAFFLFSNSAFAKNVWKLRVEMLIADRGNMEKFLKEIPDDQLYIIPLQKADRKCFVEKAIHNSRSVVCDNGIRKTMVCGSAKKIDFDIDGNANNSYFITLDCVGGVSQRN